MKIIDWVEHLFFEIGLLSICFFKGDMKGVVEMWFWLRVHFTLKGECVKSKLSFKQKLTIIFTEFIGIIIVLLIFFLIRIFILFVNKNIIQ